MYVNKNPKRIVSGRTHTSGDNSYLALKIPAQPLKFEPLQKVILSNLCKLSLNEKIKVNTGSMRAQANGITDDVK